MGNTAGFKFTTGTLAFAALSFIAITGHTTEAGRKQIAPSSHPLGKIVVEVAQIGGDPFVVGNGFVVGSDACHVLTNFHLAFGKGRKLNGEIEFVDPIQTGHVVDIGLDLNPKTGTYARKIRARVVEYGNFNPKVNRMKRNDLAILKLDECLDKSYGIARLEIPASDVHVPDANISTLSLSKTSAQTSGLFLEEKCKAGRDTPIAGLFFQTCENLYGMSGSPIFRTDLDGGHTIVGISTGSFEFSEKSELQYAIFSSVFTPFVQKVIGDGSIRMGGR